MKIALVTDTHMGARSESEAFNDYFFKFWEGTFFPYLDNHNIKQVIHLGDAADRQKYITYAIANSWRTRFWGRLRANKVQTTVLVGNHDAPNHRYSNTPNAIEELYGDYENIEVVSECKLKHYDGIPIALIPWINQGNYDMTMEFIKKVPASIAMGHLELSGFMMDKHQVAKHGMDKHIFDKFEIVMSGHYHHRSTDGKIWYLGNPYEITWADFDDQRGFHIFDTHTRELEFIQNPHKMFHQFLYDDGLVLPGNLEGSWVRVTVVNKGSQLKYDAFLETLHARKPYRVDIEEVDREEFFNILEVNAEAKDTFAVIDEFIEKIDTDLDNERLRKIMREIYQKAQA